MKTYEELIKKLQEPFPNGTVIKTSNKRVHIPVQVYMYRLENVAASQWSWRIIEQPKIDSEHRVVTVIGEIRLVDTVRQGIGVAELKELKPSTIKTAIMTAESEAFRDACDKFLMGWKDLAPYRDWANNPAINLYKQKVEIQNFDSSIHSTLPSRNRNCIVCHNPISGEEELLLTLNNVKHAYCEEHIPKQFLKHKI